jgi:prepilin-type N-terminal cleavage/methylation domain-containing protein
MTSVTDQQSVRHVDRFPKRRRPGFTLVEVLATVTILAIIAFAAIPLLSGRGDFEAQGAARRLLADLAFAQSDAMTRQEHRRIHFFDDGTGWCMVRVEADELDGEFDAENADFVRDPLAGAESGGALLRRFERNDGLATVRVNTVAIDGEARSITFDPLGGTVAPSGAPSTGGFVDIQSTETALRIEFAPLTGRARVVAAPSGNAQ